MRIRKAKKAKLLVVGAVLFALVLASLPVVIPWAANPQGQPNNIPETRGYAGEVPDAYGLWPTLDFTPGEPSSRPSPGFIRSLYAFTSWLDGNRLDSCLVLHKGSLIYEEYYNGYDADTPHFVASVTKSVVSALVGVAIQDGIIGGVEDRVLDYFPEAESLPGWQEIKRDMTIEHLLTRTSGIISDTDEIWEGYFADDQRDAALYTFLIPQERAPGVKYQSENIGMCILLGIIERASGQNLLAYAQEKLFGPLGMDSVQWEATADGLPTGGFGIEMTPRDMARFGYLYLNYGRWEDSASGDARQIMPAEYVARTPPRSKNPKAYGYLFWNYDKLPFSGNYQASGSQGQHIVILPGRDMVIVVTGSQKN